MKLREKRWMFLIVPIIGALTGGSTAAEIPTWQARISYVAWNMEFRAALKPDDVRRIRDVYIEVNKKEIVSSLRGDILNIKNHCVVVDLSGTSFDPRLIIDIYVNGRLYVYQANRFGVRVDGRICRFPAGFIDRLGIPQVDNISG